MDGWKRAGFKKIRSDQGCLRNGPCRAIELKKRDCRGPHQPAQKPWAPCSRELVIKGRKGLRTTTDPEPWAGGTKHQRDRRIRVWDKFTELGFSERVQFCSSYFCSSCRGYLKVSVFPLVSIPQLFFFFFSSSIHGTASHWIGGQKSSNTIPKLLGSCSKNRTWQLNKQSVTGFIKGFLAKLQTSTWSYGCP